MSDFHFSAAGIPFTHCPGCGWEVVPSYNGWALHLPGCPALVFRPSDIEEAMRRMWQEPYRVKGWQQ